MSTELMIPVTARPHPLSMDIVHAEFQAGLSIAEILGREAKACRVEMGGMTIPPEWWPRIRPKPGCAVIITRFPEGGSAKNILRIVAFAALAVGVALLTSGTGAAFLAGLGAHIGLGAGLSVAVGVSVVGVVGSLAINALIPPTTPNATSSTATSTNLLNAITGTGNQVNQYGAIPCAIGFVLYYPPYAALPYTELSGDDQYLRCLFDLGYGDPDPSDMKIGTTDLANYTDVETEIGVNPSLFSQDVTETTAGDALNTDGNTATRTSSLSTDELSIDLSFASGLFGIDANGNNVAVTCKVMVEFSPTGAGAWTTVGSSTSGLTISSPAATANIDGTIHVVNGERKAVRIGMRWKVTNGQYDIRVTRVSTDWGASGATTRVGDLTWTIIRSIRYSTVSTTGTKKLAMRIKATDQLSGSISQFNCILSQPIPVWHADTSTWVTQFSDNPAFVFRWLLRDCPANPRRVDESRIDDDTIKDWAAECDAKEFTYSNSLDQATTLYPLIKDVCAAGRASFNIHNGRYSVVRDELQTTPVQVFTPRNSWGFGGNRAFPDAVQALRVQFVNEEANFQQDERIVYDDGYGDMAPNLVPNGDFPLGNIVGWVSDPAWLGGNYYDSSVGGIGILPGGSAVSPTFNVAPGKTYRINFTGFQASPGTQHVYHRILYGAQYSVNILTTALGYVGSFDFLAAGSLAGPLTYTYDWTCPAGVFYASLAMYELGTAIEIYTHVTASDIEAALATKFEQMTIAGCTNASAAWRLGRYHLAVSRLRPNTYFWNADVENLICSRGSLVQFANDVIGVGLAQGRITSTVPVDPSDPDNPNIASIVLDEKVLGQSGTPYAVRIRKQDGTTVLTQVTLPVYGTETQIINLSSAESGVNPGDLVLFGELGKDSISLVITKIEPGSDYSAKLTAVDAAVAVLHADAGTPPAWISQITGQPWLDAPAPPDLIIIDSSQTLSQPNDAGNTSPVMNITVTGPWSGVTARPIVGSFNASN